MKQKQPEHGYCPNCHVNLDGGSIYEHFLKEKGDPKEALRIAKMYGATKTRGQWGREIGIYDFWKDRTVAWRCPDCGYQWPR